MLELPADELPGVGTIPDPGEISVGPDGLKAHEKGQRLFRQGLLGVGLRLEPGKNGLVPQILLKGLRPIRKTVVDGGNGKSPPAQGIGHQEEGIARGLRGPPGHGLLRLLESQGSLPLHENRRPGRLLSLELHPKVPPVGGISRQGNATGRNASLRLSPAFDKLFPLRVMSHSQPFVFRLKKTMARRPAIPIE